MCGCKLVALTLVVIFKMITKAFPTITVFFYHLILLQHRIMTLYQQYPFFDSILVNILDLPAIVSSHNQGNNKTTWSMLEFQRLGQSYIILHSNLSISLLSFYDILINKWLIFFLYINHKLPTLETGSLFFSILIYSYLQSSKHKKKKWRIT